MESDTTSPGGRLLAIPSPDAAFGLYEVSANAFPKRGRSVPLDLSLLLTAALRKYPPAFALAAEDAHAFWVRADLKGHEAYLRLLKLALEFHLENQQKSGYFLAKVRNPQGPELLGGSYYWIVGFLPAHILGEDRALFVSEDFVVYSCKPEVFGLSSTDISSKFPETPIHYVDGRVLRNRNYKIAACAGFSVEG